MISRMGPSLRVATTAVLLTIALTGCGLVGAEPLAPARPDQPDSAGPSRSDSGAPSGASESERKPDASADRRANPRGQPVRVVIPAIDVDARLVRVGLQTDGAMQVPDFGLAAWYTEGPMPGHPGPAVIVAHVDSRAGPDVFFDLEDLVAGDGVQVVYDSGDRVRFIVGSSEQTPKDELPIGSIWPTTDERLLTLVTCGGSFDRSMGHYRDNVIVYATQ